MAAPGEGEVRPVAECHTCGERFTFHDSTSSLLKHLQRWWPVGLLEHSDVDPDPHYGKSKIEKGNKSAENLKDFFLT